MKALWVTLFSVLAVSQVQAGEAFDRVVQACSQFELKSTPDQGEKYLLECVSSHIKDIEFLDEAELNLRGNQKNLKESVCRAVANISNQINDLEAETKSANSSLGLQKVQGLRNQFIDKVQAFNCVK